MTAGRQKETAGKNEKQECSNAKAVEQSHLSREANQVYYQAQPWQSCDNISTRILQSRCEVLSRIFGQGVDTSVPRGTQQSFVVCGYDC